MEVIKLCQEWKSNEPTKHSSLTTAGDLLTIDRRTPSSETRYRSPPNRGKHMSESGQDRINRYLQDVIGAERNFESALRTFSEAGEQSEVQTLMRNASARARTQHERLEALLSRRGGSPSSAKTMLAELLAFTPLSAQVGQSAAEKNTQHLIVTFGAAAAETAMYESLASVSEAEQATDVVSLARTLQEEERDDARQVWEVLDSSARDAYQTQVSEGREPRKILASYLEDVIASEKAFQMQLDGFAKEARNPQVAELFRVHASETEQQHTRLTAHLKEIGGSTSVLKGALSHIFAVAPKVAQLGHDVQERQTQDLMMAFAVENAEVAMYETLICAARLAGDEALVALATSIQSQERSTAEAIWPHIAASAKSSLPA